MGLRVALVQSDIVWEDKSRNLEKAESCISSLSGKTDIVVFPEMFSTGFSMNTANLAEEAGGYTVSRIKEWAKRFDLAICGSYMAKDTDGYYNRGFFITSQNEYYYDKRHLFRMGSESEYFSSGKDKVIFEHKGFNICLLICYDLRFPIWARNVDNQYDVLIYVANWPASRMNVWQTLLTARAIENMAYVCGVNRVGHDGLDIDYNGGSMLVDAKGNALNPINSDENVAIVEISKESLSAFRRKFPVWKDADKFEIKD